MRTPRTPGQALRPPLRRAAVAASTALLAGVTTCLVAPPAPAVPAGAPVVVASVPLTPWEIVPLPDGGSYVVQRDGGVVHLDAADRVSSTPALTRGAIPSVRKLLGLALAPDFATSGLAYLYVGQGTDPDGSGPATGTNGIWRLRAVGADRSRLEVVDRVFGGIDSDGNHDGGRMVFGPDGALYVTTGDIHQPSRPQDLGSLNGKILRMLAPATGPLTVPSDNPWAGRSDAGRWVWSSGHRHPQGLAFTADGRLWETEHGPSGERHGSMYPGGDGRTGRDELNLITRGGNYGWPLVSGPETRAGTIAPLAAAGDSPAWAPGDLAVGADGSLYAPFLNGRRLHRFDVRDGVVVGQGDLDIGGARLRVAVARGADLLVAEDGGDGRIHRVPLTPAPVAPTTPTPTTPTPAAPTTPAPPVVAPAPAAAEAVAAQARSLGTRVARAVGGRRALARLAAGRAVRVDVASALPGRVSVRLVLGRGPGRQVVRAAPVTVGPDAPSTRLALGPAARVLLRRQAGRPVTVQVRSRLSGAEPVDVVRRARPGRAPR